MISNTREGDYPRTEGSENLRAIAEGEDQSFSKN